MLRTQETARLVITPELLTEYKKTFPAYLKSKESECNRLRQLTDDSSWYGGIMASVIEFVSPWLGFGDVDVSKAKLFLNRVFDENKKQLLEQTIAQFETSPDNREYLQKLFDTLPMQAYQRKDRPTIVNAMHLYKHKKVPNSDSLGIKNNQGEYILTDENFFPYAVSNLFAFHILESNDTIKKLGIPKRRAHQLNKPTNTNTTKKRLVA